MGRFNRNAFNAQEEYKLHKEIASWKKDDRGNVYRVNIAKLGEKRFLDIRMWYTDADSNTLRPGKGISLPIIDDNIDQLLSAMDIVADQWESGELLK